MNGRTAFSTYTLTQHVGLFALAMASAWYLHGSQGCSAMLFPIGTEPAARNGPPVSLCHSWLPSSVFIGKHVLQSQPVVFRRVFEESEAGKRWTDDYLRDQFGSLVFSVDSSKKEDRAIGSKEMSMSSFLDVYQSEDLYLISTLPMAMRRTITMPDCLLSHAITERIQDVVMWFSSGGSKSHLHVDTVDNLYCLVAGHKQWLLVDKNHTKAIVFDHPEGDYSSVNVDGVDFDRYPFLREIPWQHVNLTGGDCLFIPNGWAHHVRSVSRNIAVNIWWAPLPANVDLNSSRDNEEGITLADFAFNFSEQYRHYLHEAIGTNESIDYETLASLVIVEASGDLIIFSQEFRLLDLDSSGYLTTVEIQRIPSDVLQQVFDGIHPGLINAKGKSASKAQLSRNNVNDAQWHRPSLDEL